MERSSKLTRSQLPLFGYGFFRRHHERPWFSYGEYIKAMPMDHRPRAYAGLALSRSSFSELVPQLTENGLLESRREAPEEKNHPGRLSLMVQVTDSGVETMLDSLTYRATHEGRTIPAMLLHPIVAEVVLEETDLKNRIIAAVSGLAVWQERAWG